MSALNLRPSLRVPLLAALALVVSLFSIADPASAAKAKKKKRANLPTVTSVAPLKLSINDTLIIKGKNFLAGEGKNTILFRAAAGGKTIFAPSLSASTTRIVVKVPSRVGDQLTVTNGVQQPTRFQIRVVSTRASTSFTPVGLSPLVLPLPGGSSGADCDKDGQADNVDGDDDNDGLSDAIEIQYGLNTCNVDSDGDTVWDSFEFESALDLNGRAVPYPGKKPWPNPLDATDIASDFDGDGLKLGDEHRLWQAAGRPFPLNYSDGTQYTGGPIPAPVPDTQALDNDVIFGNGSPESGHGPSLRTGEGYLSDDERDFDGDGLSNIAEFSLTLTQAYWTNVNADLGEKDYIYRQFNDLDPTNPDTDGDGIVDGLDDQDNDGWNNMMEQYRAATYPTGYLPYMVNPFNPCLPDYHSPTCTRYLWAGEEAPSPFHLNAPLPSAPLGWVNNQAANSPNPGYVP